MENTNETIIKFIIGAIKDEWSKVIFLLRFSDGAFGFDLIVDDQKRVIDTFSIDPKLTELRQSFKSKLKNPENKFNRVKFKIFKDETYTVEYYWDQEAYVAEKQSISKSFSSWLNWRLETMIYEAGYPDFDSWQKAITEFTYINGTMHYSGKIYVDNTAKELLLTFPQYMVDSFIEHYEITNKGILSHVWPKWNKLTIESHHAVFEEELHEKYELI
jgi:hypothetical protein